MATFLKSAPHYNTSDWFANNEGISVAAERERSVAQEVKQEAR